MSVSLLKSNKNRDIWNGILKKKNTLYCDSAVTAEIISWKLERDTFKGYKDQYRYFLVTSNEQIDHI